ncbi:secA translation cis-regulator SecM [Martelella alba]|uniref:SecA regulator SecM n=1 Tax=Martelella alba TaxID=2590451 RepID=A0ABY2STA5_9HYPH|nr:secA translation cis-regulator SecM [Martelella alba]TKI08763.1 secA regulator SecM [Martelella alba]
MGILNCWRQFGRRYFWPHLLLGMVAASLGVPYALNSGHEHAQPSNSLSSPSRQNVFNAGFGNLALLGETPRRAAFTVDYWHQHAIRTAIRHLTIAWAPPRLGQLSAMDVAAPLEAQHQVLLSALSGLLTHEAKLPSIVREIRRAGYRLLADRRTGIRLVQPQEIRAGPALLN